MIEVAKGKEWFKRVFDAYYESVRNYLYYLSGDIDLSEDLAQDVFIKVWENRENVNDETIKPFLFRIGKNLFINNYKRKTLDIKFVNTKSDNTENESPEYILETKEFDKQLQDALSSLPELCRTYFLLNRIDDMKYQDIAAHFGVSVKSVEKQMSKALRLLREKIDCKV